MQIYPVLDIRNGIVVHAVRGQRERYAALESRIVDSAEPVTVARALRDRFGLASIYVADLDALGGAPPARDVLTALVEDEFRLLVDAGVRSAEQAAALRRLGVDDVIVALETLPDIEHLRTIVSELGPRRVVFSLDLRDGVPITTATDLASRTAEDLALEAHDAGARRMIVLDLTSVGSSEGPTRLALLRALRARLPDVELITGGGVRTADDLATYRTLGVDGVLVATALHRGTLEMEKSVDDREP